MKRYLIFAHDQFYPSGGVRDLKWSCEDYAEAKKKANELSLSFDVSYVYDSLKSKLNAFFFNGQEYGEYIENEIEHHLKQINETTI
mgnify:CR=1 FL=1